MTHYKHGNEKQGEFVAVIPDEQITEGSFEATVCLIVDHVLDLSAFESDFNNDAGGAPAYKPSTLLKVILSAYHRGITSSRKIEHLCRYNTVFMALSGFLTPDHSTIAAFVSRAPKRLEPVCTEVVLKCDYLGLVGGETLALDGCKMPSSNGVKDLGRQVSIRKDTPAIDRMKRKIDSPEDHAIYANRTGVVEPVFAHMKHVMGLRWFSLRGLKKVNGQWFLFCAVHNLVKIQKYGSYA